MTDKQKRLLKLLLIAVAAGICTLLVAAVSSRWGAAYREIPENASEWKEPENEEVQAKVDEIVNRILNGEEYGFDELLYVMDHDSAKGQKVKDYLVEQGKQSLASKEEAPDGSGTEG